MSRGSRWAAVRGGLTIDIPLAALWRHCACFVCSQSLASTNICVEHRRQSSTDRSAHGCRASWLCDISRRVLSTRVRHITATIAASTGDRARLLRNNASTVVHVRARDCQQVRTDCSACRWRALQWVSFARVWRALVHSLSSGHMVFVTLSRDGTAVTRCDAGAKADICVRDVIQRSTL